MSKFSKYVAVPFPLQMVFFLLLFSLPHLLISQVSFPDLDKIPENEVNNLDIYLVIGQSNMAGRAKIRAEDTKIVKNAFLFTSLEKTPWVQANNPLNRYSTVRKGMPMQRLSPAYSFAQTITNARPNTEIGLVVNALGGTKIVQWLPNTKLYNEAVTRTHQALKSGKLKGVIWLQGESDADAIRTNLYLGRLEELVNGIREEFDNQSLPFIVGQFVESEKRSAINELMTKVPSFIPYSAVVSNKETSSFDGTHYDSKSAILLGNRYAEEMLTLLKK